MIIYDKYWLEKEIACLRKTIKLDKKNKADTKIMLYFFIFSFITLTACISAGHHITCPTCENPVYIDIELGVKSGKWKCPNRKCGYENDNRMRYCSLCGSERQ